MTVDPVLLVDDEDELRVLLRDSLRQAGFQVEDAADAQTALALMEIRHFPVVITDLNMPGGPTGFDLIQAVKARDPRTLCVVITGYASLETAVQAVKFGAYDFVQKPFKLAEIEAVLDRALDHATLLNQLADYQRDLEGRVLARVQDLKDYQEEVLKLNDLLLASQDQVEEGPLLAPFLEHLAGRLRPRRMMALLTRADGGWRPLQGEAPLDLPAPAALLEPIEWGSREPDQEGFLIPLRRGATLLAALYLELPWHSGFQLDDPAFLFWRRQIEAALHGLARVRAARA
jgi:FixJ family two-component response regulator